MEADDIASDIGKIIKAFEDDNDKFIAMFCNPRIKEADELKEVLSDLEFLFHMADLDYMNHDWRDAYDKGLRPHVPGKIYKWAAGIINGIYQD